MMILFFHLLNDNSGSPKVLKSIIETLKHKKYQMRLFIGSSGTGILDTVGITTTKYWYHRTPYKILTFFTYFISQFILFISLFLDKKIGKNDIIYINTLLPFGAALYGKLTKRPVIYHLHEVSISPSFFRWFLISIARLTAKELIYVSFYHKNSLPIPHVPTHIIYNSLDDTFLSHAAKFNYQKKNKFRILMLASLKDYKGIPEFISLAKSLEEKDIYFDLVINDKEENIKKYFSIRILSNNIKVYPKVDDPTPYYANADLVLNLSRPDQWIETFGLTLLEAMAFGIPVIAPPIGGPAEIIRNGQEGFLIDCRHIDMLSNQILKIYSDNNLYMTLSRNAQKRAKEFSAAAFSKKISQIIERQINVDTEEE